MATTTNFGWETPDDTDLVKDGAAAMRTLGSSIDTTTKNLNPQTTTGALAYRSATNNVNTALAIGTAGQVLTVNSGATAPEWATPTSGGMTLLSTTTLSGASTTVSTISQGYKDLLIVVQDLIPANDGEGFCIRLNSDANTRYFTTQTSTGGSAFNDTKFNMTGGVDNSVGNQLAWFKLTDYTNTITWKMIDYVFIAANSTDPTQVMVNRGAGAFNQTGAISAVTFLMTAGNLTSGTALIYGVK